jgi:8-oxo-dGTP diphosphatase
MEMSLEEEFRAFIEHGYENVLHHLTTDCAIFGYHGKQLKILLIKWRGLGGWGLPGGYVQRDEGLDQAAARVAQERTSLHDLFLHQYHTFGSSRYRLHDQQALGQVFAAELPADSWFFKRTVSVGYYALVDYERVSVRPDLFSDECRWWDVQELPELLFDHQEMVAKALATMRQQLYFQPIGSSLLANKFTLPEIHTLYETLLNRELNRRNFPQKLLTLGLIEKLDEQRSIGGHRSPFLYRFVPEVYAQALQEGLVLV